MDPLLTQILYLIGFEVIVLLLLAIFIMIDIMRVVHEFRKVSEKALYTANEVTDAIRSVGNSISSLLGGASEMVGKPHKWFGKKKRKKSEKRSADYESPYGARAKKTHTRSSQRDTKHRS